MRSHLKILGWFHIALGSLFLFLCLPAGLFFLWLHGQVDAPPTSTGGSVGIAPVSGDFVGNLAAGLLIISVAVGGVGIVAGSAILKLASWGRVFGIVVSILDILCVNPFLMALGIYGLVVLLDRQTAALFRHPEAAASDP